jgi:hypothetical protein
VNVALKEWASVVTALGTGKQILLLRKGGIVEANRGFEVRHQSFLFFPTFEHQHVRSLKPEFQALAVDPGHELLPIQYVADVTDVFAAPKGFEQMLLADPFYVWNESLIRMRYEYRPDLPLYVIFVRIHRLAHPQAIPNRPSYAGCKSWVNLTEEIDIEERSPVVSDHDYSTLRRRIIETAGLTATLANPAGTAG